jgi:endonuclease/exonuclease/phosphatase family metal-dependent hydrolase
MTAYTGQTQTTLGHLCPTLWDSQSRPVVIKPDLTGVCCLREVQKALSRARSLYERWEELLEEGTQVHTYTHTLDTHTS